MKLVALSILVAACGGTAHGPTPDATGGGDPAVGPYTGTLVTDTDDLAVLALTVTSSQAARAPFAPTLDVVTGTATFPATSYGTVAITGTYDPQTHALAATLTGTGLAIAATFDGTTFTIAPSPHVSISILPGPAALVQAYCGTFQATDQTVFGRWTLLAAPTLGLAAGAFAASRSAITTGGVIGGTVDASGALALTLATASTPGTASGQADGTRASGTWSALGTSGDFAGTLAACPTPEAPPLASAHHTIAVGTAGYFLAVTAAHTVVGWGDDTFGELGDGRTNASATAAAPATALGLTNIVAVAAGDFHALALASDGTVYGWGLNQAGELGGVASTSTPTKIAALAGHHVVAIAAGNHTSLAIDAAGAVIVFGANDVGQLGANTGGQSITLPATSSIAQAGAVATSGAGAFSLALVQDSPTASHLVAMGDNSLGQLGDGTTQGRATPTAIATAATTVLAAAAGYDHAAAILDGALYVWGSVQALGTDAVGAQATPLAIAGAAFPRHVAAGRETTFFADTGGGVWSFGSDQQGALGTDHANQFVATPTRLPGLAGVVDLAASNLVGAALTSTGDVYTWGAGIGTTPTLATTGVALP